MVWDNRTGKGNNEVNASDQQKQIDELKELVRKKDEELARFHGVRSSEKYKSRLFSYIFGREENKRWTLRLYNAVNHSDYKNPEDIQLTTIENVIYMGMQNDLSFIVADNASLFDIMSIYEQQSSYNPNCPVRQFIYAGMLYEKYVHANHFNIYGTTLLPLPIPKLVVLYNGKTDKADDIVLKLSDSFREGIRRELNEKKAVSLDVDDSEEAIDRILREADPDIEVRARMININYGHNAGILDQCKPLKEYAWFVDQVRIKAEKMDIEQAIDQAVDEMPEDFEIKKFITDNRTEVAHMLLTEYNEAETMQMFKDEGRQEGRQEGLQEGTELYIKNLMQNLKMTMEQAMDVLGVPSSDRALYISKIRQ